ncbi:MAG: type IX secretion system membrane protein PorP/SprF [Dysgonamonadaceae bacterium]|nr:type IX secretion system membrane protein PorP/SprF [Dysgonamonadaceae bacterium]
MKRLLYIINVLLFVNCFQTAAQYDAQISNYWAAISYYNPGYAGETGKLEMTALNRQQWLGFSNAPRTMLISADMPFAFLGRTHGVGAIVFTESLGLFKHSIMAGQYAYKKKLFKGDFSVGFQVSKIDESWLGSKVEITPPEETEVHEGNDDGIPMSDIQVSAIDFSLGFFYSYKWWHVGLSVTHLLEPEMREKEGTTNIMYLPRGYYLMSGCNIQLSNPLLELRPSVFVKSTIQMTQLDLSARLFYNKMFYAGLGWRYGDAGIAMLGAKIKNIQAGYAYDFPISAIRKGTTGSHEIFLKYSIDINLNKGTKNKYKSVRIL